jgi:uncharacterized protein (DUF433 family)
MVDIVRTEGTLGGVPRLDGTRIGVLNVYELVVEGGHEPADIADQLDCSLAGIYAALAYYYKHAEEMRTLRESEGNAESKLSEIALSPPEHVAE